MLTVTGRTVLVEDKILGAYICLVFKEHVEIEETHLSVAVTGQVDVLNMFPFCL